MGHDLWDVGTTSWACFKSVIAILKTIDVLTHPSTDMFPGFVDSSPTTHVGHKWMEINKRTEVNKVRRRDIKEWINGHYLLVVNVRKKTFCAVAQAAYS